MAVNVWYHVGSKNETAGRTGFAHLFEHVMFTGSGHVPYGTHDKLTEGVGGSNNGTTSNDRTTYYETVPANYLESALWLEADRMGFLLDTLDIAKLNAQRDIVKNERRQSYDNQPYGRANEILSAATYPAVEPVLVGRDRQHGGSVRRVGSRRQEFLQALLRAEQRVPLDRRRLRSGRRPRRGSRSISATSRAAARSRRPTVAPVKLAEGKRLVYEDHVQVPRLYVQWPTVGEKSDDQYALDVLGAILTGPRTARLTKALVYDQQAAAGVSAGQGSNEDVGEFLMVITPRPGHSLTDLEAAADAVIEKMKAEGPTAEEIQKAVAGEELGVRARTRVQPEQGDDARRRRRIPRRPGLLQGRNTRRRWP